MDSGSICLFLTIKELSAQVISSELVTVIGPDAITYSTLTKYLRQRQFPSVACDLSEEPPRIAIDNDIRDGLEKEPFSSIHEQAKFTCIPTTIVHQHLTPSPGFIVEDLRWVPHSITDTQQVQSFTLLKKVFHKLRSIKQQDWQFMITRDELLFYLTTNYEQIRLRPDQEPPEKWKHTVQDQKTMVTIVWNSLGFHMVDALPKGRKLDAKHQHHNHLTALVPLRPEAAGRKLVIHTGNSGAYAGQKCIALCAENGLRFATHPLYSPDLAPSDLFVWTVKCYVQGRPVASHEELFAVIGEIVPDVPNETVHRVLGHWMERLKWIPHHKGDYCPWPKHWLI
jgi:hypothetical protein